jgi:hypothetical protein
MYGVVQNASDIPIRDAQVSVDGTPFYAKTSSSGLFDLKLLDIPVGQELILTLTHQNYEDKQVVIKLHDYRIQKGLIVLNPISP